MSKRNKKKRIDVVYSTNPDFNYDADDETVESLSPEDQMLNVHLEKKARGGKTAVLVKGFVGSDEDLKELGKILKSKCGVGGSSKNGEIIIQGDVREKVMDTLNQLGYRTKRVGG